MLLTKNIDITINSSNIKYYEELGFEIKVRDIINISIEKVTHGSCVEIEVKCDVCGKIKNVKYYRYLQNIEKHNLFCCSRKCANIKRIKTNLEKYGVENASTVTREKAKQTCLEKYGVENAMQNNEIKEKLKKTCLEKYGVECVSKNDNVKEKMKQTNLEKYGVSSPIQNKDVMEKLKKTCLEKYEFESYMSTEEFKEKSKEKKLEKYGDENYHNIEKTKTTFKERYGEDWYTKTDECKNKTIKTNLKKYGVVNPNCNKDFKDKSNETRKKNRIEELKNYNIVDIDYEKNIYTFKCDSGGEHNFEIEYETMKNRKKYGIKMCTICNDYLTKSGNEINISDFIKNNYNKVILENKKIIKPYELDIYLPDLKLAIEFNGLYWHNELYKKNDYHLIKTEMCEKQGIQLFHIFEDGWIYKQEIIKSMILEKLNKTPNKIQIENCVIKEIADNKLLVEFLKTNHFKDYIKSKIQIGLYHNSELVSLMIFAKNKNKYELLRFCNKLNTNIDGAEIKLFNYFINNFNPEEISAYSDRSYDNSKLYEKLGFNFIKFTAPDYSYVIGRTKNDKLNFRKCDLIKEGFDSNKSEHEIMFGRKIYRIYDSGNSKFIWINKISKK